jgi:hypothetical protein
LPEIAAASGDVPAACLRASCATSLVLAVSRASASGSSGRAWSDFTASFNGSAARRGVKFTNSIQQLNFVIMITWHVVDARIWVSIMPRES